MRHFIGLAEQDLRLGKARPIFFEPSKLLNSHLLITGPSGTGKSFQALRILESAALAGIEIDVFDVHEELQGIPASRSVKYSQATGYGYNPLILDLDPHVGGVLRQAEFLVTLIKTVTPSLGDLQTNALRNLIVDTYAAKGIFASDPATWRRSIISETKRDELRAASAWAELRKYYPTLEDLKSYAERQLKSLTLGADNKAVTAFDQLIRTIKKLNRAQSRFARAADQEEIDRLETTIESAKITAVEKFQSAIENIETGRELDQIYKYASATQLSSLIARLDTLNSTGIFRANEPPFGGAPVKVHALKSLTSEQQILFVKLRLRAIFEHAKKLGPTATGRELRHICFLDEASRYFTNDPDDILNAIAREARKYGVGLWLASQNPTDFPPSFLTNCGTIILTGMHTMYWKKAASMLQISPNMLKQIRPTEVLSIKTLRTGETEPPFELITVPNSASDMGRRVAGYANKIPGGSDRRYAARA